MISRLSQSALPALVLLAAARLVGCATTDSSTSDPASCEATVESLPIVGYWALDGQKSVAQFCPKGNVRVVLRNGGGRKMLCGKWDAAGDQLTITKAGHAGPAAYHFAVTDAGLRCDAASDHVRPTWMGPAGSTWRRVQ